MAHENDENLCLIPQVTHSNSYNTLRKEHTLSYGEIEPPKETHSSTKFRSCDI